MQGPMRSTRLGTATHQFHCILLAKQVRAGTVSKGGAINSILDGRSFKVMLKGVCIKRGMDSVPFLQSIYLGRGGLILKSTYQVKNMSPRLERIKVLFVSEELHHAVSFYVSFAITSRKIRDHKTI